MMATSTDRKAPLDRRQVVIAGASTLAGQLLPSYSQANVRVPYDWNASPPMKSKDGFIEWMKENRGEDPGFLGKRWDRFQELLAQRDIWGERDKRAFLLAPREDMVIPVGRPGSQHVLKISKQRAIDGAMSVARSDIYNGSSVSFVPFTKLEGDAIRGTHRAD